MGEPKDKLEIENSDQIMIEARKKEYFRTFLLNYLYYNIINCRIRKIEITEIVSFFNKIYNAFMYSNEINDDYNKFQDYAIHTEYKSSFYKTCIEIEELAKELSEKREYKEMFHVTDGKIIIDNGFSFSPTNEKYDINKKEILVKLKRCFYYTREDIVHGKIACSEKVKGELLSFYHYCFIPSSQSLMEACCNNAIQKSNRPEIDDLNSLTIISDDNYEIGKLLAARFIYRCGKAWFINNIDEISRLLRTESVIIEGLDSAHELRKIIDKQRISMISKYLELAKRFAILLAGSKNNSVVFDADYRRKEYDLGSNKKPDPDEAFMLARKNYIINCINSDYQSFIVKKDKEGNVILSDSGLREPVNINFMSKEKKEKIFGIKEAIDKVFFDAEAKYELTKISNIKS